MRKYVILAVILSCILSGCNFSSNNSTTAMNEVGFNNSLVTTDNASYDIVPEMANDYGGISDSGYTYTPSSDIIDQSKKLIRNVSINLVVYTSEELQPTVNYISELASKYDGYISYASTNFNEGYDYGSVTMRIPRDNVDSMIVEIQQQSFKVNGITDSYDDVTTEYTDLDSRLKMKKIARDKYMELLEQAETTEDMLSIQRELNIILEDLESAQSRMNLLNKQIDFTEVRINIESVKYISRDSFAERFKNRITDIAYSCGDVFIGSIGFLICGIIVIVCVCPVVYLSLRLIVFSIKTSIPIKFKKKEREEVENVD